MIVLLILLTVLYLEGFIFWLALARLASKFGKDVSLLTKIIITLFWPLISPFILFFIYTSASKAIEGVASTLQLFSNSDIGGFVLETDETSSNV